MRFEPFMWFMSPSWYQTPCKDKVGCLRVSKIKELFSRMGNQFVSNPHGGWVVLHGYSGMILQLVSVFCNNFIQI